MEPVIRILDAEGYDLGYATFWEGNVITEITDGKYPIINISIGDSGNIKYRDWLTLRGNRDIVPNKPFFIIGRQEKSGFTKSFIYSFCKLIYEDKDGQFTVYSISNPVLFKQLFDNNTYGFGDYGQMWEKSRDSTFYFAGDIWLNQGHDDKGIRILSKNGVSYGPYISMTTGVYRIEITGDNLKQAEIYITYNNRQKT